MRKANYHHLFQRFNSLSIPKQQCLRSIHERFQVPPAPAFLNDFNVIGASQPWTASAYSEHPITKMHRNEGPGFLGQVFGKKKLRIYSPYQLEYLYQKKAYNLAQPCWVDIVEPSEETIPNYAQAKTIEAILLPGEMRIQPTGWFHSVYALDPVMSVSYFVVEPFRPAALAGVLKPQTIQTALGRSQDSRCVATRHCRSHRL